MTREKTKILDNTGEKLSDIQDLVLYNDDFNTFDFVIETLIEVCEHDHIQAEQCALLTHFKGRCGIRSGTLTELKPYHSGISGRGLSCEIE